MNLAELFGPMGLVVPFAPVDKWEAIGELVQQTVARGSLTPRQGESALEAVLRRERSMSTGMEKGIAIPHAAMDGLSAPVACLGITPAGKGIAFESMDGAPAELVVLLLIPKDQKLLHIRTLAEVARVLGDPAVRATLSAATTPEEAFAALDRAS
ncbi:MAG: PTS sugar transporter subunit IIA [Planctomycetes bacterium]|nr:PTS sugar transporter subunit IIA [Planctomycetota bacterium]MCB9909196.1 PTS sugar transporter subunit IIA [Planctomycetota bacterium]